MDRINGANTIDIGGGRRGFIDENPEAGVDGTDVMAAWLNGVQENISLAIENAGLALNQNDWMLLSKAIARMSGGAAIYGIGGGTGNAQIVATPPGYSSPAALFDGMIVRWKPVAPNNGPATLDAFTLGRKALTLASGVPLVGGELRSDFILDAIYFAGGDGGNGAWSILPWTNPVSFRPSLGLTDTAGNTLPNGTFVALSFNGSEDDGLLSDGYGSWDGTTYTSNVRARYRCQYRSGILLSGANMGTSTRFGGSPTIEPWLHGAAWVTSATGAANIYGSGEFILEPGEFFRIEAAQSNTASAARDTNITRAIISIAS